MAQMGLPPQVNIEFAERLKNVMNRKGISASDLARMMWGETTNDKGYKVAKNRDRIGKYLRAYSLPDTKNLNLMAEKLGVDVAELVPERTTVNGPTQHAPIRSLTPVPGQPDKVHVRIDVIQPQLAGLRTYEASTIER